LGAILLIGIVALIWRRRATSRASPMNPNQYPYVSPLPAHSNSHPPYHETRDYKDTTPSLPPQELDTTNEMGELHGSYHHG
jgi:hypothetical protein